MTLSGRNVFFKAGILLTALCLLVLIAVSIVVFPVYSGMDTEGLRRSAGFIQQFLSRFLKVNLYAAHMAAAVSVLYGFAALVLIFYFFEKTQCPEILFVALFAGSFSFEVVRLIIPLEQIQEIPSLYILISERILLFGRYFGLFSLFAASVYAAGLDVQKQRNIFLTITVVTLIFSLGIPVDAQTWDSSFNLATGYAPLFRLIEAGTFVITTVSFFAAASTRGSPGFIYTGFGSALVFAGRNILLAADNWAGLCGIVFLALGTWLISTRLHKIYLWL
ncbi:MAG: hypothetical protein LBD48_12755 [Treponema sp.]|jgi:hypothetical protein|nr:hypothetical protein [Treponema sp.]